MIRQAAKEDLSAVLALYQHLKSDVDQEVNAQNSDVFAAILADPNHYLIVLEEDGMLVASCVLVIIPNLTRMNRPYGLIENVVTHAAHRGKGHAKAVLEYAKACAVRENCYKIMLMTGAKQAHVHHLYESAGYNSLDKIAYIQWL